MSIANRNVKGGILYVVSHESVQTEDVLPSLYLFESTWCEKERSIRTELRSSIKHCTFLCIQEHSLGARLVIRIIDFGILLNRYRGTLNHIQNIEVFLIVLLPLTVT